MQITITLNASEPHDIAEAVRTAEAMHRVTGQTIWIQYRYGNRMARDHVGYVDTEGPCLTDGSYSTAF